jgi:hypothetical protein
MEAAMTMPRTRREFLADFGRGALTAAVGLGVAENLGLGRAWSQESIERIHFGPAEPLVRVLQETSIDQLLPRLVEQLRSGTSLKSLVGAAALANARSFAGEDYVGFHTLMALTPAWKMSAELPEALRPLPVFKVLYRNTARIHEAGGRTNALHPVELAPLPEGKVGGEVLRDLVRKKDEVGAERLFAGISKEKPVEAFDHLLYAVQDNAEVHRVALPYRARCLIELVGDENAHTLLRQSLRYCLKAESNARNEVWDQPRTLLPRLFDRHGLEKRAPGTTAADDAWVDRMSQTLFKSTPEQAADAAAAALAEGIAPDAIGEAISLAANQLILRDHGRRPNEETTGKPIGSVHGDSIGVHACDSANAWRQMARVSNARNTFACLILGAWQAAFDRVNRGGDFLAWQPLPVPWQKDRIAAKEPADLLRETDEAIRGNLQARAAALVHRYGELGLEARPIFDLMLRYAVSEDGSLHAEKYYRTAREEFESTRPAFRWRQLVALARVTASEYGRPAAGVAEARRLLGV